jgi:hypothetical protein
LRPAERKVEYDEVIHPSFSAAQESRRFRSYSSRSISSFGSTVLCLPCAAHFTRMVALRTVGRRIANAGFLMLVLGALVFGYVSTQAKGQLAPAVALGLFVTIAGAMQVTVARLMRPRAMGFLLKR